MAVRIHSARSHLDEGVPAGDVWADNRLALLDQAFYEGHRAAGQKEVMQVGWVYDRPIDLDQLRQMQDGLARGLLGRLIERSPLPFGRHRWVAAPVPRRLAVADRARPRSELGDWFDECTQQLIDPESGPGWRIEVLPLADGATAVSLVLSHYVIDGIGGAVAVTEAVLGMPRDLGYPPPRSRSLRRALIEDATQTFGELPAAAHAFVAAVREARRRRDEDERSLPSREVPEPGIDAENPVVAPSVWIRFEQNAWNARAAALGGTHSTLAAAFTAALDARMGRQHGGVDGVPVLLTVNDRTSGDDARAIAVKFVRARIGVADLTTDLAPARSAIKNALKLAQENDDGATQLVPLTPFTPKRTWRGLAEYARNDPEQPAVCSNLGDTGPAAIRPDGSLCDAAFARGASQHLTRRWLDRIGSQVHVYYGTATEMNLVTIYVCAFGSGSVSTRAELGALVARVSQEFGLVGRIE
ncbi:Fatty acyl-AMP ligase FadD28 and polyketide synthase [Mycolicibacterium aurum]|uniref:Fatty acyl-AMP ligase FadD28 and polyketide synthase n=2 Tax=Mycolicibacterium aurum TaxID=1791 RepID=A0A3S4RXY5_MYCAU|nr:Fatty acyl-AMP ligase FadD28 and polyketide synthase [Mycolicibacterium aurum]